MRFTEKTTSADLVSELKDSIFDLLDDIEVSFEQGKKGGADERLLAVRTRKKILKYFYDNGGM